MEKLSIDDLPRQPAVGADWLAWLVTEDRNFIMVQIAGNVTEARAIEIVRQMAGEGETSPRNSVIRPDRGE